VSYDPAELDLSKMLRSPMTMDTLKKNNGWMYVGLGIEDGGHQILIRLDQEREKAWLFDPNIGLLCFESNGKSFD
jgi:hypothetical protein